MQTTKLLLSFLLALGCVVGTQADPAQDLIGQWKCTNGGCPDQEIGFAVEDSKPVYRSWFHGRPSVSDGQWRVDGTRLTTTCCNGTTREWDIIKIDAESLTLRLKDGGDNAEYARQ